MRFERGAATIELTIIAPFMVLLVLACVEFGVAWQKVTAGQNTARTAAVAAFTHGDTPTHDQEVVRAVVRDLAGNGVASPEWVVIFDANTSSTMPASCITASALANGGVADTCASYSPSTISTVLTSDQFDNSCGDNPDSLWCATGRGDPAGWRVGIAYSAQESAITGALPFFQNYDVADTIVVSEYPRGG